MSSGSKPQLEIDGQVAVVRLRRPERANRLEPGDLPVLTDHFRRLREQHAQVRAVVLTGTGRHFSAGFDLGAIDTAVKSDASTSFADMVRAGPGCLNTPEPEISGWAAV